MANTSRSHQQMLSNHGQTSLFQKKELIKLKTKPAPKPKQPIELTTIVPFGNYKGCSIDTVIQINSDWIIWWSKSSKRPLSQSVLNKIASFKNLAQ